MASREVLGRTNKRKLFKAWARELTLFRRSVHRCSNIGGSSQFIRSYRYNHGEWSVGCSSQFIRSYMYNVEMCTTRFNSTRERRRGASDRAAHQDGRTLKESVAKLMDRVNQGVSVDSFEYNHILKWCSKDKDLESVKQVNESIKDSQMEQHPYVANMLLKCYLECGKLETARELFNKLPNKDTVAWTMMIGACVKHDQAEGAIEMYTKMRNEGGQPNAVTYLSVLKACASPTALKWGKDIHAHILSDGVQGDVRVGNALVQMYAKTGRIADAKQVFDEMPMRDVISWNVMISGLAEHGLGHEAFSLFLQMQREGIKPDVITYVNLLNSCSSAGAEEWLREVHAHAFQAGLDTDVRVGSVLVQMYARTGLIADAKQVFNKMRIRDVVCWTVMIGGLAEHGLGYEAFSLFLQMQREGIIPDAITYLSILNPRSSAGAVEWLKEVHAYALKAGLDVDVRVGNAFVQMYAKSGLIDDAKQVFEKMTKRDITSWNMMIGGLAELGLGQEAFSLFLQMQKEGITPDAITYLSILNPCSSTGAVGWLKEVHEYALKAGLDVDVRVGNVLVQMYFKTGLIADAKQVFKKMKIRNLVSWTVMIGGLAKHGLGHEAFSLFVEMQREGITPDEITYVSILNPCSCAGAEEWLKEVHAYALKAGLDVDVRVGNALVQMYAKTGLMADAKQVFSKMQIRDVISWTVMIGGLAEHGLGQEAFSLFLQMQREGITPDAITYLSILNPCSCAGAEQWLKKVHAFAFQAGLDVDVRVGNALVQMYAKTGLIADAKQVFTKMRIRDVISWTGIIGGLAEHGLGREAFSLFLQMQREGITPDAITYLSILNPCSSAGAEEWLKEVHAQAFKGGFNSDVRVGNALVQMYAKTGLIAEAKQVFDKMRVRDAFSWTVMIGGLSQHGHGREALELFDEMKTEGVKPIDGLFVAVLSACSHAGLVEEGRSLFDSMMREYGIEPGLEHFNCVVDMLGRAGLLKEAQLFILNMPIKPNVVTWMAFLGACRIHKHVELAELAGLECLKLKPTDGSAYVLLSNVFASVGNWNLVSSIRSMMQERGICKDPGRCSIEVGNKVHDFLGGDTSHPETREIYTMLSSLSEKLKAEGYTPDTRLVLRNIAEEDKESAICSHSEKLAIAYGLMHVPAGKPIRVYKNLRICPDCHAASKLVSKTTGREIVARDANRFHHFRGGSCSCGDYW